MKRLVLTAAAMSLGLPLALPITITSSARSIQPGEVVRLTIAGASATEPPRVQAFDRALTPYALEPGTWRVLVGIDLETRPGSYDVSIETGPPAAPVRMQHVLVVTPKSFRTRTLTVDEAFVNPPASVTARIQAEAAELDRLWKTTTPSRLWTSGFVVPVPDPANSAFGSRSVFNGQARSPHTGADFLSAAGTAVHAPADGRVVLAKPLYYSGNTVILDHGLGLYSLFAHLSAIDVQAGDTVTQRQQLGLVGATGRVTGAHLHWAVRLNGARVDPLSLLVVLAPAGKQPFWPLAPPGLQ